MNVEALAWTVLFLPLGAALAIALGLRRWRDVSAGLSTGAVALAFLASLALLAGFDRLVTGPDELVLTAVPWLELPGLSVDLGLRLDRLSVVMLPVVTGVGLMIHLYSRGYMNGDPGVSRYFASLSLFMFSMLGIVLASNFVLLFVFWELVGVSSYLLIGFWFDRPAAADAARKAFLTNRLGDFGFLLGIILVWSVTGSVDFLDAQRFLEKYPGAFGALAGLAGVLVFMGAMGKSAQFPLHVWLPDAMEGPTPVSALIHAATMVAAGVHMLCRVFFLFQVPAAWPAELSWLQGLTPLDLIAWVGGITALLSALMAIQQDDIKRILAYSTLSQLGYMVMAVGCAHPDAGMFHLVCHAFFKALLFLGAGSVIHALHEQDIWRMGGLRRTMPVTWATFLLAALALCGVPPLSGFYSKDAIIASTQDRPLLFALGVAVAGLTAFYMTRLFLVAFQGRARTGTASQAHESPAIMSMPLRLLAVPTVFAGFWGIEAALASFLPGGHGEAHALPWYDQLFAPFGHSALASFLSLFAAGFGFAAAFALYRNAVADPLPSRLGALARWMRDRFYFDELYGRLIRVTQDALASFSDWIDRWLVAGLLVRGTHGTVELVGRALRLVQSGNVQTYAFLAAGGLAVVLWAMLR